MHILIVDDEADLRDLVSESLSFAGFDTTTVSNGLKALKLLELVSSLNADNNSLQELYYDLYPNLDDSEAPSFDDFLAEYRANNPHLVNFASQASELIDKTTAESLPNKYDLVILDEMMPMLSGVATLAQMREVGIDTPVIFLSAKSALNTKISAFDAGSDDYIVKPFDISELIARVNVVINRNQAKGSFKSVHTEDTEYPKKVDKRDSLIIIDKLQIDLDTHDVLFDGNNVELTPTQYDLLLVLASNRGRLLSKNDIFEHIWGQNGVESNTSDPSIVETYVCAIRNRLKKFGAKNIIETKRGGGYLIR